MIEILVWIAAVIAMGSTLVLGGRRARWHSGLSQGRTLDLDNRTLYSAKYGLAGRPDRIIRGGIPEEWKSALRVHDSHRVQMGVYFILLEEDSGTKPPYGVIVTGDGQRHRIENTAELRRWVLNTAAKIRSARRRVAEAIPVSQPPAKCKACGQRGNCGQASG